MSKARQSRQLARRWAEMLGAASGAEAVVDFAMTGGTQEIVHVERCGDPHGRRGRRLCSGCSQAWAERRGAEPDGCGLVLERETYSEPGEATADELLATIARGQESWDTGAINAGAAEIDRCPRGYEKAYYAAYERAAVATVRRLAAEAS